MLASNKNFGLTDIDGLLSPPYDLDGPYLRTYSQYGPNIIQTDVNDFKNVIGKKQKQYYGEKYINMLGFASDEFTTNHIDQHVLFVGCSNTFAGGMPDKYIWSKKIQEDLFPNSGFFNLGMPGIGIEELIYNTFLYIKNYGKPEAIFCLMPNFGRGLNRNRTTSKIKAVQAYTAFEEYCIAAGIILVSMTWDHNDEPGQDTMNNLMPEIFKTFYAVDLDKLSQLTYDRYIQDPTNKIILKWDEQGHFGIAQHDAYYKIFKEIYLKEKQLEKNSSNP